MTKKPGQAGQTGEGEGAAPEITSEAALDFIRKMQKAFPREPRTKAEKERLRKYLAKFTDEQLKAVGRRVQSDVMQRPPRTISPKGFGQPPYRGGATQQEHDRR
jgi:hypothetical protein